MEKKEYLKRYVVPGAAPGQLPSDEDVDRFMMVAEAYGLDPLLNLVFATRRRGQLVVAPTIAGLRALAAKATKEWSGQDEPEFGPPGPDGIPEWCKVTVYRRGCDHGATAVVFWEEYVGRDEHGRPKPTPTQRQMPRHMLAKAAEALAIRKLFPEALVGVAIEEMGVDPEAGQDQEPKAVPWEDAGPGIRRPDPPKVRLRPTGPTEGSAQDPPQAQQEAQQAQAEAPPAASASGGDASEGDLPPPNAVWVVAEGADLEAASAPVPVQVKSLHREADGTVAVVVAHGRHEAQGRFAGRQAGRLAVLRPGDPLWARVVRRDQGAVLVAYHVPVPVSRAERERAG